jgi:hypothetical protein
VRENIYATGDGRLKPGGILWMCKDRQAETMGFVRSSTYDVQGHISDLASALHGSGEKLDTIRAILRLRSHPCGCGIRCGDDGHVDVIYREIVAHIGWRLCPEGFSCGQNVRTMKLAAVDPAAQLDGVLKNGGNVEYAGEAPAIEHRVKLLVQSSNSRIAHMEEARSEDMDMAVPKASRNKFAGTVDGPDIFRYWDGFTRTDGSDTGITNNDHGICDGWRIWRWIHRATDECQVSGLERHDREEDQRETDVDRHI